MPDPEFTTSVAARLHVPWPAHATPPAQGTSCTNLSATGACCPAVLDGHGIHAMLCQFGGGVVHRHNAVARALASIIHSVTGAAVHIEKRTSELRRVFRGRLQEGQMDLIVADLGGGPTYIDVAVVSPVVATAPHLAGAAKKPGYAALRAEFGKRQRYPVNNIVPFVLELGGRAGPSAQKFVRDLFKTEGSARGQSISDVWANLSSALHTATACHIIKTGHAQPPLCPTQLDSASPPA